MDVQSSCRLSFESLNSTNELSIFYRVHLFISSPGEVDSLEHIHSLFNLFLHSLIRAVTVWNIYKVTPYNNVFTCILNHCLTMNTYFSSNTELGLCLSVCLFVSLHLKTTIVSDYLTNLTIGLVRPTPA